MTRDAAERVLDLIAKTTAAGRACWLVDNDGPGVGRVTVWWECDDHRPWRGHTVHRPVIDDVQQAGLIDVSHTVRAVGDTGPAGSRVQLTPSGWATRRHLDAPVIARQIQTWRGLP